MTDFDATDFFIGDAYVADPYPYFEFLRSECPVRREPHHDVVMVTGLEEAVEVYRDSDDVLVVQLGDGSVPRLPVALEGDDVSALIAEHRDELPMSDQLPRWIRRCTPITARC